MINYRKTWQPPIRCNYWMSIIQLCCPQRQFGHPWKKKVTQERIEIKFGKMKLGVQRRGENGIWYRLAHGKGEKCEASTAGAWPVRNVWNVCLNKCSNSKITEVTSVGEVTVLQLLLWIVTGLLYSLILLKSNFTDPDFVFFFPLFMQKHRLQSFFQVCGSSWRWTCYLPPIWSKYHISLLGSEK